MYHDQCKTLSLVDGPEGTQTSNHWEVHLKSDQLSYLLRFKLYSLTSTQHGVFYISILIPIQKNAGGTRVENGI